jgi:hypothetical protein
MQTSRGQAFSDWKTLEERVVTKRVQQRKMQREYERERRRAEHQEREDLEEEDMVRMMDDRRKEREREVWELERKYAVQRAQRER